MASPSPAQAGDLSGLTGNTDELKDALQQAIHARLVLEQELVRVQSQLEGAIRDNRAMQYEQEMQLHEQDDMRATLDRATADYHVQLESLRLQLATVNMQLEQFEMQSQAQHEDAARSHGGLTPQTNTLLAVPKDVDPHFAVDAVQNPSAVFLRLSREVEEMIAAGAAVEEDEADEVEAAADARDGKDDAQKEGQFGLTLDEDQDRLGAPISALVNLAASSRPLSDRQQAAKGFAHFSTNPVGCREIATFHGVAGINCVVRLLESHDATLEKFAALTLGNIAAIPKYHPRLVRGQTMSILIGLARDRGVHTESRSSCLFALANLAISVKYHNLFLDMLPDVLSLCEDYLVPVQKFALQLLQNLAANKLTWGHLTDHNVLDVLGSVLLRDDVDPLCALHCVATIQTISTDDSVKTEMCERRALPIVSSLVNRYPEDSLIMCEVAGILCSLSTLVTTHPHLLLPVTLNALYKLSSSDVPDVAFNATSAAANLCQERNNHSRLTDSGLVALMVVLCGHEDTGIREAAARGISNLAGNPGLHRKLLESGVSQALVALLTDDEAPECRLFAAVVTASISENEQIISEFSQSELIRALYKLMLQCGGLTCAHIHRPRAVQESIVKLVAYVTKSLKKSATAPPSPKSDTSVEDTSGDEPTSTSVSDMEVSEADKTSFAPSAASPSPSGNVLQPPKPSKKKKKDKKKKKRRRKKKPVVIDKKELETRRYGNVIDGNERPDLAALVGDAIEDIQLTEQSLGPVEFLVATKLSVVETLQLCVLSLSNMATVELAQTYHVEEMMAIGFRTIGAFAKHNDAFVRELLALLLMNLSSNKEHRSALASAEFAFAIDQLISPTAMQTTPCVRNSLAFLTNVCQDESARRVILRYCVENLYRLILVFTAEESNDLLLAASLVCDLTLSNKAQRWMMIDDVRKGIVRIVHFLEARDDDALLRLASRAVARILEEPRCAPEVAYSSLLDFVRRCITSVDNVVEADGLRALAQLCAHDELVELMVEHDVCALVGNSVISPFPQCRINAMQVLGNHACFPNALIRTHESRILKRFVKVSISREQRLDEQRVCVYALSNVLTHADGIEAAAQIGTLLVRTTFEFFKSGDSAVQESCTQLLANASAELYQNEMFADITVLHMIAKMASSSRTHTARLRAIITLRSLSACNNLATYFLQARTIDFIVSSLSKHSRAVSVEGAEIHLAIIRELLQLAFNLSGNQECAIDFVAQDIVSVCLEVMQLPDRSVHDVAAELLAVISTDPQLQMEVIENNVVRAMFEHVVPADMRGVDDQQPLGDDPEAALDSPSPASKRIDGNNDDDDRDQEHADNDKQSGTGTELERSGSAKVADAMAWMMGALFALESNRKNIIEQLGQAGFCDVMTFMMSFRHETGHNQLNRDLVMTAVWSLSVVTGNKGTEMVDTFTPSLLRNLASVIISVQLDDQIREYALRALSNLLYRERMHPLLIKYCKPVFAVLPQIAQSPAIEIKRMCGEILRNLAVAPTSHAFVASSIDFHKLDGLLVCDDRQTCHSTALALQGLSVSYVTAMAIVQSHTLLPIIAMLVSKESTALPVRAAVAAMLVNLTRHQEEDLIEELVKTPVVTVLVSLVKQSEPEVRTHVVHSFVQLSQSRIGVSALASHTEGLKAVWTLLMKDTTSPQLLSVLCNLARHPEYLPLLNNVPGAVRALRLVKRMSALRDKKGAHNDDDGQFGGAMASYSLGFGGASGPGQHKFSLMQLLETWDWEEHAGQLLLAFSQLPPLQTPLLDEGLLDTLFDLIRSDRDEILNIAVGCLLQLSLERTYRRKCVRTEPHRLARVMSQLLQFSTDRDNARAQRNVMVLLCRFAGEPDFREVLASSDCIVQMIGLLKVTQRVLALDQDRTEIEMLQQVRFLAVETFSRLSHSDKLMPLLARKESIAAIVNLAGGVAPDEVDEDDVESRVHLQVASVLSRLTMHKTCAVDISETPALQLMIEFLNATNTAVCSLAVLTLSGASSSGVSNIFVVRTDAVRLISVLAESSNPMCQDNVARALMRLTTVSANFPFILRRYNVSRTRSISGQALIFYLIDRMQHSPLIVRNSLHALHRLHVFYHRTLVDKAQRDQSQRGSFDWNTDPEAEIAVLEPDHIELLLSMVEAAPDLLRVCKTHGVDEAEQYSKLCDQDGIEAAENALEANVTAGLVDPSGGNGQDSVDEVDREARETRKQFWMRTVIENRLLILCIFTNLSAVREYHPVLMNSRMVPVLLRLLRYSTKHGVSGTLAQLYGLEDATRDVSPDSKEPLVHRFVVMALANLASNSHNHDRLLKADADRALLSFAVASAKERASHSFVSESNAFQRSGSKRVSFADLKITPATADEAIVETGPVSPTLRCASVLVTEMERKRRVALHQRSRSILEASGGKRSSLSKKVKLLGNMPEPVDERVPEKDQVLWNETLAAYGLSLLASSSGPRRQSVRLTDAVMDSGEPALMEVAEASKASDSESGKEDTLSRVGRKRHKDKAAAKQKKKEKKKDKKAKKKRKKKRSKKSKRSSRRDELLVVDSSGGDTVPSDEGDDDEDGLHERRGAVSLLGSSLTAPGVEKEASKQMQSSRRRARRSSSGKRKKLLLTVDTGESSLAPVNEVDETASDDDEHEVDSDDDENKAEEAEDESPTKKLDDDEDDIGGEFADIMFWFDMTTACLYLNKDAGQHVARALCKLSARPALVIPYVHELDDRYTSLTSCLLRFLRSADPLTQQYGFIGLTNFIMKVYPLRSVHVLEEKNIVIVLLKLLESTDFAVLYLTLAMMKRLLKVQAHRVSLVGAKDHGLHNLLNLGFVEDVVLQQLVTDILEMLSSSVDRAHLIPITGLVLPTLSHLVLSNHTSIQLSAASSFFKFVDSHQGNVRLLKAQTAEHGTRVIIHLMSTDRQHLKARSFKVVRDLSAIPDMVEELVHEGVLPKLCDTILRDIQSSTMVSRDSPLYRMAAFTLLNVVMHVETHEDVVATQGVEALVHLLSFDDRELLTIGCVGLSHVIPYCTVKAADGNAFDRKLLISSMCRLLRMTLEDERLAQLAAPASATVFNEGGNQNDDNFVLGEDDGQHAPDRDAVKTVTLTRSQVILLLVQSFARLCVTDKMKFLVVENRAVVEMCFSIWASCNSQTLYAILSLFTLLTDFPVFRSQMKPPDRLEELVALLRSSRAATRQQAVEIVLKLVSAPRPLFDRHGVLLADSPGSKPIPSAAPMAMRLAIANAGALPLLVALRKDEEETSDMALAAVFCILHNHNVEYWDPHLAHWMMRVAQFAKRMDERREAYELIVRLANDNDVEAFMQRHPRLIAEFEHGA